MLFKKRFHAGLRDGSIDLTFRRWSRAQVRVGGRYRFDGGPDALVVDSIDRVPVEKISGREAKRAGFPAVKAKALAGTVNHATKGAPLVRRQIEQWQLVSSLGGPPGR